MIFESISAAAVPRSLENPSVSLLQAFGVDDASNPAGVPVNHETAMRVSAFFACVRVIAETIATTSAHVFERKPNGAKVKVESHWLAEMARGKANREMTWQTLFEVLLGSLASWGNMYLTPEFDTTGDVIGLWPLLPDRTAPYRTTLDSGARVKRLRSYIAGQEEIFRPVNEPLGDLRNRFVHVPLMGFDGLKGYSVIGKLRRALGVAIASSDHGALFFKQGAHFPYVVTHPTKLGKDGRARVREPLQEIHGGLSGAHQVAVLDEGMTIANVGMPLKDAQFLDLQKFSVEDIARPFRMQPHKIGHLEHATFSNIEMQSIEHVVDTLRPYPVRMEATINSELFTPDERRRGLFIKWNLASLMRGDADARGKLMTAQFAVGGLSPNQAAAREDLPPSDEPTADQRFVPLNYVPLSQAGVPALRQLAADGGEVRLLPDGGMVITGGGGAAGGLSQEQRTSRSVDARRNLRERFQPQFLRAAERFVSREAKAVLRAIRKAFAAPSQPWRNVLARELDRIYQELPPAILRELRPILAAFAPMIFDEIASEVGGSIPFEGQGRADVEAYATEYAARHVRRSRGQLDALIPAGIEDDVARDALTTRAEEWIERRPEKFSFMESVRSESAISKFAMILAGVVALRWVGGTCDLCRGLNGTVVAIREVFVKAGETVQPKGSGSTTTPLKSHRNVGHPPLHRKCGCSIVAEFRREP